MFISHSVQRRKPGPVATAATFHCFTLILNIWTAQQRKSHLGTFSPYSNGCGNTDQESSCIHNSTHAQKDYQEANLLWGAGSSEGEYKELCDLQN